MPTGSLLRAQRRIGAAALLLCILSAAPVLAQKREALADAPVLGGPSVLKVEEAATVSGTGLPANTAVTVVVVAPGGAKSSFSAVTDAKGRVDHRLAANASGRWEVLVLNTGGRELARTAIQFLP